jgi:hypothetical protein
MRIVWRQCFTNGFDKYSIVRRDANAASLQQMAFDFQVKIGGQGAQQVVGRRPQVGVGWPQIQKGHIEQGARDIFGPNFLVNSNRIGLG